MIGTFKVPSSATVALQQAKLIVSMLPECETVRHRSLPPQIVGSLIACRADTPLRCHEVARVVKARIGHPSFEVVDGQFMVYEHSWLVSGELKVILDPYAVGQRPLVQLIDPFSMLGNEYKMGDPRTDIKQPVIDYLLGIL